MLSFVRWVPFTVEPKRGGNWIGSTLSLFGNERRLVMDELLQNDFKATDYYKLVAQIE